MAKIGIICGLPVEARCLVKQSLPIGRTLHLNAGFLVHTAGMGPERAKIAAGNLIKEGVKGLISWGTAGGLSPNVFPGDLLLPQLVINLEKEAYCIDENWRIKFHDHFNNLVVHSGTLLQVNQIITSTEHKRLLFETSQALAVDMESAAIAAVAQDKKIPFLAIRTIVDDANFHFPQWLHHSLNAHGRLQLGALGHKLVLQPSRVKDLVRLAQSFANAKATLNKVATLFATEKMTFASELVV